MASHSAIEIIRKFLPSAHLLAETEYYSSYRKIMQTFHDRNGALIPDFMRAKQTVPITHNPIEATDALCPQCELIFMLWIFDAVGVEVERKTGIESLDALWYPGSDDVWILDRSFQWLISLDHEEIVTLSALPANV